MADNSTQLHAHGRNSSLIRHHRMDIKILNTLSNRHHGDKPSAFTLHFIRQFARVYRADSLLPDGLDGFVVN